MERSCKGTFDETALDTHIPLEWTLCSCSIRPRAAKTDRDSYNLLYSSQRVFLTYLSLTVKHHNKIVTVSHSQLLAEDGNFAILAVSNEYRWLGRADHDRTILTFVNKALSNVIVYIKLAIVAEIDCKVFAIELARITVKEFALLFCKQKLSVSGSLCCSVSVVPRFLSLAWRWGTLALCCCSLLGS